MYVRDLSKNEYPMMATYTMSDEINGNMTLSADLLPNKPNSVFIEKISEFWELVTDDGVEYVIVVCETGTIGNLPKKKIVAIPKAYDDLERTRVYERYEGSFAVDELFRIIFRPTDYSYRLMSTWNNIRVEGFGDGDDCLSMLKYVLDRIGAEFYFTGNSFTIQEKIGAETQIMFRRRLNASNIVREIDGQQYYTYARGYGDYREDDKGWENAKLIREYTSPLASLIKKREAPPIKNANITKKDTMDANLKKLVDNSIQISVTANLFDLRDQNYPYAQSNLGDSIFLIDEINAFNETVRIVKRDVTKSWNGKILDLNFTFGSQGMVDRYTNQIGNVTGAISDILEGRKRLPFAAMAHEIQILTGLMLNVQTQLTVAENGSLLAINKSNPNLVVIFNANGLFVSEDGGETPKAAITGRGIMGESIIAYSITADKLEVNAITVGFNNSSSNIKLFGDRIEVIYRSKVRARLTYKVLEFLNDSQQVMGKIDSVNGGVLLSTNRNGFVGLGQDLRDDNGNGFYSYNILVDPNGLRGPKQIMLTGVDLIDLNVSNIRAAGYNMIDALRVGQALKGETVMIPTSIASDGTVNTWKIWTF